MRRSSSEDTAVEIRRLENAEKSGWLDRRVVMFAEIGVLGKKTSKIARYMRVIRETQGALLEVISFYFSLRTSRERKEEVERE